MTESLFNKIVGRRPATILKMRLFSIEVSIKNEVFSIEVCETLPVVASVF